MLPPVDGFGRSDTGLVGSDALRTTLRPYSVPHRRTESACRMLVIMSEYLAHHDTLKTSCVSCSSFHTYSKRKSVSFTVTTREEDGRKQQLHATSDASFITDRIIGVRSPTSSIYRRPSVDGNLHSFTSPERVMVKRKEEEPKRASQGPHSTHQYASRVTLDDSSSLSRLRYESTERDLNTFFPAVFPSSSPLPSLDSLRRQ